MHPSYEQLLEQAKQDPASVDFSALRMAYTETPAYSPHTRNDALDQQLNAAMAQQDWSLVLQICQERIENNALDIKAHLWAKTAYEQLQQSDHAWHHYHFANALLDSIKSSGDGLSASTAYILIDSSEKWAFLESQGYQFLSEQRHPDPQHIIDIVDARDAQQRNVRLFFNLDITDEKTSAAIDGPRKLSDFGIHADEEAFAPPQDAATSASTASTSARNAAHDQDEEHAPSRRRRRRRRDEDEDEDEDENERPDNKPSLDLDEVLKNLGVKLGPNKSIYTSLSNLTPKAQTELAQLHKSNDRMKVGKGAGWFLASFGLLSGLGIFAFWFFLMSEAEFRNAFVIMTILFAFFGAMCLVWGAARLWGLFRSRVGSFFFPHSFFLIRTEFDHVEAWPYVFLYPDACALTHHTTDGNYSYSDLQLHFLGYGNVGITFHDMHLAEDFLGQVFQQRADTFADLAESDFKRAQGSDLMHTQGPIDAVPAKRKWLRPAIWVGITVLALIIGSPINAYFIEEYDWDRAVDGKSRYSYEFYLRFYPNGRYANDARIAIDNAAFETARKDYTAVAFRKYLNEFPQGNNTKPAREMLQDLYEKALTRYRERIGTPNRSTGLILKILEDLKKHDTYTVFVRFTPNLLLEDNKDANAQKALDLGLRLSVQSQYVATLKRLNTYIPSPIKPAFRPEENFSREQYIVQQLDNAFRAIIPQGIMDFARVEQAPPNARVVLHIKYDIRQKYMDRAQLAKIQQALRYSRSPSATALREALNDATIQKIPVIYTQTRSRSYGYRPALSNAVKTPVRTLFGVEMDWSMDIQLAGQPPEKFTFASDAAASIRLGGRTSDPIDVYRQIAQSAFQRFSLVLQKQFGVYGLPRYNPRSPYGGLGTYRARPSANPYIPRPYVPNPYVPRPYVPRPYTPPASPLSVGAGTPTGTASVDNFVNAMPPAMRAAYMAKPHFQRRMDTFKLWTQLDSMYFRLPYNMRRLYARLPVHKRRLRMLNVLERNKKRAPTRTRKRPANDDPFGP